MKISTKKHSTVIEDLSAMALPAHRLIMAYVEGKPVDFNRLENYMAAAVGLAETLGCRGVLTENLLTDLFEGIDEL